MVKPAHLFAGKEKAGHMGCNPTGFHIDKGDSK